KPGSGRLVVASLCTLVNASESTPPCFARQNTATHRPDRPSHVPRGGLMSRRDDDGFRDWRYEAFEERLALSVQPVADFWYDTAADSIIEPSSTVMQPVGSA